MTKRIRTTVIAALCAVLLACVGLGAWLLRSSAAEAEAALAAIRESGFNAAVIGEAVAGNRKVMVK